MNIMQNIVRDQSIWCNNILEQVLEKGMETLKATNVSDLVQQLLVRYGISEHPPSSIEEAHTLLTSKTKECRQYQQRVRELQYINQQLQSQNKSHEVRAREAQSNSEQLLELQKRIQIFESAFNEEKDYVGELKQMLSVKEEKVKQMIDDYEREIEELKSERGRVGGSGNGEMRAEIQDLKSQLEVQENMIISLMGSNAKLKEENKSLRNKVQEPDK